MKTLNIFLMTLVVFVIYSCGLNNVFEPEKEVVTETVDRYIYIDATSTNISIYTNQIARAEYVMFIVTSNMYVGSNLEVTHSFSRVGRLADTSRWTGVLWEPLPYIPDVNIFCEFYKVSMVNPTLSYVGSQIKIYVRWTEYSYIVVTNF